MNDIVYMSGGIITIAVFLFITWLNLMGPEALLVLFIGSTLSILLGEIFSPAS